MTGTRRRILLLDDNEALRVATAIFLRQQGLHVEEAADLAEADWRVRSGSFDALVLDRDIDGIDSVGLLRRWRRDGIATPAMFVTAMTSHEEHADGLRSGAEDYLLKPFTLAELDRRIGFLVEEHSPHS